MTNNIVPKNQKIEITLIRDGYFYLYSRYIDGKADPVGKVITRERALEIYKNNQDGTVVHRHGWVDFGEKQPCNWDWTVQPAAEPDLEETAV